MRYFIICGEPSGDMHAANMLEELKQLDQAWQVTAWGGDRLKAAGALISKHIRELSFMGFTEVVKNLPTIFYNFRQAKQEIISFQPDVLVLVDFPGFNLRMAQWAKKKGIKVLYYISPQLWAWKESRIKVVRSSVDLMLVILPFEKAFYARHGIRAEYVGHPLLDELYHRKIPRAEESRECRRVVLLPGSREQEVKTMLPVMLQAAEHFPDKDFTIAASANVKEEVYRKIIGSRSVKMYFGQTYELLSEAQAAWVTSGTATLETALFNVPQIVCYKGGYISYMIARRLVKVKYISLVNLILNHMLVKELIQDQFTVSSLVEESRHLFFDQEYRKAIYKGYADIREKLREEGASRKAASYVFQLAQQ